MFQEAKGCIFRLYDVLPETKELTGVKEILGSYEYEISELEQINIKADRLEALDCGIFFTQNVLNHDSHQITSQIPGVLDYLDREPIPFSRLVELFRDIRKMQFIRPMQTLKGMCSPATTLRDILNGQGDAHAYKKLLENLKEFRSRSGWHGDEMQRQLWRLQVLLYSRAFLPCPLATVIHIFIKGTHSTLYTGTF